MKYYQSLIEKKLNFLFIVLMGITLSTWVGFIIWEGMNQQVEWWRVVVPAALLLGCAFHIDISSIMTFGRWLIIAWKCSPSMTVVTRRYGVIHGIAEQAAVKTYFLACL